MDLKHCANDIHTPPFPSPLLALPPDPFLVNVKQVHVPIMLSQMVALAKWIPLIPLTPREYARESFVPGVRFPMALKVVEALGRVGAAGFDDAAVDGFADWIVVYAA